MRIFVSIGISGISGISFVEWNYLYALVAVFFRSLSSAADLRRQHDCARRAGRGLGLYGVAVPRGACLAQGPAAQAFPHAPCPVECDDHLRASASLFFPPATRVSARLSDHCACVVSRACGLACAAGENESAAHAGG